MSERMIEAGGIELCSEDFGDPCDPPILLMMGRGGSMLWWDERFCRLLSGAGRFVIRYDQRDTGRSVTYEPGRPGYTADDLVDDAPRLLDAYGIPAAHIVGLSAGGGFAQLLALDHPDRVLSLTLISTSPAMGGGRKLPPPTQAFSDFFSSAHADSSDIGRMDYLVDYCRALAGGGRPFDEAAARELLRRDMERARNHRSVDNHELMPDGSRSRGPLSSIAAPTLVIHGTADPLFPPAHGEALAEEIPGATLLLLEGAGHSVDPADWQAIVDAIARHTQRRA